MDLAGVVGVSGAGVFSRAGQRLVLTQPSGSVSRWRLPRWFYPDEGKVPLTYFPRELWRQDKDFAYVQRRGPGQEFVLDMAQYPESRDWLSGLLQDFAVRANP